MLIPLYYTTGQRKGSVQQNYLLRSLGVLFGLYFTVCVLFIPKIMAISASLKGKGEEEEGRKLAYGMAEDESSEESMAGDRVQFYSDNVIRRSGGTSQASVSDSEGPARRSSGTGSSIGR